jgi:hypothetical protein
MASMRAEYAEKVRPTVVGTDPLSFRATLASRFEPHPAIAHLCGLALDSMKAILVFERQVVTEDPKRDQYSLADPQQGSHHGAFGASADCVGVNHAIKHT